MGAKLSLKDVTLIAGMSASLGDDGNFLDERLESPLGNHVAH